MRQAEMRYSNFRSTYIPFEDEFFNSMDPDRSKITPEHKIYIIIQLELGPKNRLHELDFSK